MEPRNPSPTDRSDRQWALRQQLVPTATSGGRPEQYPTPEIWDAIVSILRGGGAWRLLPHDLPPWLMVSQNFWHRRHAGTWQRMPDRLRGDVRVAAGKRRQPSAGGSNSPSVQTT